MGDIRISIRQEKSANTEALYVIVNDSFIDMSAPDAKTRIKKVPKGTTKLSAILVRNDASAEAATARLRIQCGKKVLLSDFSLEVPVDQELARAMTTFVAED